MAQIPQLNPTTTLDSSDETILRQGTTDKRISLELANTLAWAKREGYSYQGEYQTGVVYSSTEQFYLFDSKPYFVEDNVSLPYTTTISSPEDDSNLYIKNEVYFLSKTNGANLLSNHNFLVQSPDSITPPSSNPTDYVAGTQIFSGVFVGTDIVGLTYINGRVSFLSGDFYFSVPNTEGLEYVTEFTASVADFDGKPRARGVSFTLVGDEYRVTVGVDALEDVSSTLTPLGSVKFEQGSVATGHKVEYGVVATGSTTPRPLSERFADVVNVKDFGATGDGTTDDTEAFLLGGKVPVGKFNVSMNNTSSYSYTLSGKGKSSSRSNLCPVSDGDTVLNLCGNDGKVSSLSLSANSKTGTTAISFAPNGESAVKFYNFQDIRMDGFDVGLNLENAYYNYFSDIMYSGNKIGLSVRSDGSNGWSGANTFMHNYFASGTLGILNYTTDNTVFHFYSPIFEGHYQCIRNYGSITFENGYFGDGGRYDIDGSEDGDSSTYEGHQGSMATFRGGNSLAAGTTHPYGDGRITAQIRLKGVDGNGARVEVVDKGLTIGNQNIPDNPDGQGRMFAYLCDSRDDTVRFDNVPCSKSTINQVHNQAPILYHTGFTPLYSRVPKSNYIVNGTFASDRLNAEFTAKESMGGSTDTNVTFDDTYMNQYGGKVMIVTNRYGIELRYSVPEELVGKRMALIYWVVGVGDNTNSPGVQFLSSTDLDRDDGNSGTYAYFTNPPATYNVAGRTPERSYLYVIPTKKEGRILLNLNQYDTPGVLPAPEFKLGSIILTEAENMYLLDQFVDVSNHPRASGTTADRPTVPLKGEEYMDTDLGKPIYWTGSAWNDAVGVPT